MEQIENSEAFNKAQAWQWELCSYEVDFPIKFVAMCYTSKRFSCMNAMNLPLYLYHLQNCEDFKENFKNEILDSKAYSYF